MPTKATNRRPSIEYYKASSAIAVFESSSFLREVALDSYELVHVFVDNPSSTNPRFSNTQGTVYTDVSPAYALEAVLPQQGKLLWVSFAFKESVRAELKRRGSSPDSIAWPGGDGSVAAPAENPTKSMIVAPSSPQKKSAKKVVEFKNGDFLTWDGVTLYWNHRVTLGSSTITAQLLPMPLPFGVLDAVDRSGAMKSADAAFRNETEEAREAMNALGDESSAVGVIPWPDETDTSEQVTAKSLSWYIGRGAKVVYRKGSYIVMGAGRTAGGYVLKEIIAAPEVFVEPRQLDLDDPEIVWVSPDFRNHLVLAKANSGAKTGTKPKIDTSGASAKTALVRLEEYGEEPPNSVVLPETTVQDARNSYYVKVNKAVAERGESALPPNTPVDRQSELMSEYYSEGNSLVLDNVRQFGPGVLANVPPASMPSQEAIASATADYKKEVVKKVIAIGPSAAANVPPDIANSAEVKKALASNAESKSKKNLATKAGLAAEIEAMGGDTGFGVKLADLPTNREIDAAKQREVEAAKDDINNNGLESIMQGVHDGKMTEDEMRNFLETVGYSTAEINEAMAKYKAAPPKGTVASAATPDSLRDSYLKSFGVSGTSSSTSGASGTSTGGSYGLPTYDDEGSLITADGLDSGTLAALGMNRPGSDVVVPYAPATEPDNGSLTAMGMSADTASDVVAKGGSMTPRDVKQALVDGSGKPLMPLKVQDAKVNPKPKATPAALEDDPTIVPDYFREGKATVSAGANGVTYKWSMYPGVLQEDPYYERENLPVFKIMKGGKAITPNFTKFFLESVSVPRQERVQVIETFGEWYAFFYGEAPSVYTFNGVLLNAANVNWLNEMDSYYDSFLRGTRTVLQQATVHMMFNYQKIEGFVTNFTYQIIAQEALGVRFSMSMLVSRRAILPRLGSTLQGDTYLLKVEKFKKMLDNPAKDPQGDLYVIAQSIMNGGAASKVKAVV